MFPARIVIGVLTPWTITLTGFSPANGDMAELVIKPLLLAPMVIESIDDPDATSFNFEIPANVFPASTNTGANCQIYVTGECGRRHIASGSTLIVPDLSGVAADFDPRTQDQKILDAINAVIEGRAGDDEAEMEVGGAVPRKIKFISSSELLRLRDDYELRVAQAQNAEYVASGGKIYDYSVARFVNV